MRTLLLVIPVAALASCSGHDTAKVPGLHADGHLSLGGNIAAHDGVSIAYTALQNSCAGSHPELMDRFGIKEGDKMYRPESERVSIW